MSPDEPITRRLLQARSGALLPWRDVLPASREQAWAVQDATVAALGGAGGWKVGGVGDGRGAAPLPTRGLLPGGSSFSGPQWRLRGLEVELAVRLARDVPRVDAAAAAEAVRHAAEAALPVVEVVESRLAEWRESDPLAQMADLANHGALVLGDPVALPDAAFDLSDVVAYLALDGQPVASARGANPAGPLWDLLGWLALHAQARGRPLRAGDVITTGSCSGLVFAAEGTQVQAELQGFGRVSLSF